MHAGLQARVDVMVKATLVAVDHGRASYQPSRPFRAWLLELACHQVMTLGEAHADIGTVSATAAPQPVPDASVGNLEADRQALPTSSYQPTKERHQPSLVEPQSRLAGFRRQSIAARRQRPAETQW
jgi:hypothetical protein